MKKVMMMAVAAFMLIALSQSCKKKVSDADLKTNIEAAMKAKGMSDMTVEVKDGVATIAGNCKDEACTKECEKIASEVKGVKSVVNNCKVAAPASVTTSTLDAAVQQKIQDGLKDIAGVQVAFDGSKAVFTGTTTQANKMKINQMCASSKVAADLSKVTVK
jgi:hyperosmotically inducible periplasmic protein